MILAEAISRLDSRIPPPPPNQTKTLSFCPAIDVNSYGLSESLYPIKRPRSLICMSLFFQALPKGPRIEFKPSHNNRDMAFSSIIMMCSTRRPFKQSEFMHAYYFRSEFKREHGNLTAKSCHSLLFFSSLL